MTSLASDAAPALGGSGVGDVLRVVGSASEVEPWIDHEVVCVAVLRLTPDTVTFVFELPDGIVARHLPGQYVVVSAQVDGAEIRRCYTISSPPTRPQRLAITVKRHHDRGLSGWLHAHCGVGTRVRLTGPFGEFSHVIHPAGRYLFLAAGSGVTPALSMVRTLFDQAADVEVAVVFCARTPVDVVARLEWEAMAAVWPGLHVTFVCESGVPTDPGSGALWQGGQLSADVLTQAVSGSAAALESGWEVFTCGPEGFMALADRLLEAAGVPNERRHVESFDLGTLAVTAPIEPPTLASETETETGLTGGGHRVELHRSRRAVVCAPGETILAATARAGIRLPSACTQGMCGTCVQTKLSGDVEMHHQGGIRPRDIDEGRILPCCTVPRGDVVIDA